MSMCRILFSDIDGTCVHYHDPDDDDSRWSIDPFPSTAPDQDSRLARALCGDVRIPTTVLRLPPSTSGSIGIISLRTLQLYAAVRSLGIKVVLISGCRTSTLLQRLPFLPACDAYVCESGGRIFYPNTSIPTALQLSEDYAWRRSHEGVAGPIDIEILQPEKRSNPILWSFYQHLHHNGYTVDARNYSTAFRVKIKSEQEKRGVPALPQGLSKAENLGAIDIYPSTSGKRQAARYLMEKFGTNEKHSMFMCDDDNDIELAEIVSKAYLPSITSSSMRDAVNANPHKFIVANEKSVWATEEILHTILRDEMIRII